MLAIIPARGGSKGVPGKNIKTLKGKPLISYTIEAALEVPEIERIVVTTDSIEIAEVAVQYGAEVPFIRPHNLATDDAVACDVYLHAVEYMRDKEKIDIESFMVLLPTAPFRNSTDIKNALDLFYRTDSETLVSMTEADVPISWYYMMNSVGRVYNAGFDGKNCLQNRQNNARYYIPNGAIYILNYKLLKNERTYYSDNTIAYIMERSKSIDIDTLEDFQYAEYLMGQYENKIFD